jgi:hypothetical protein
MSERRVGASEKHTMWNWIINLFNLHRIPENHIIIVHKHNSRAVHENNILVQPESLSLNEVRNIFL